jgi:hypothetical protein
MRQHSHDISGTSPSGILDEIDGVAGEEISAVWQNTEAPGEHNRKNRVTHSGLTGLVKIVSKFWRKAGRTFGQPSDILDPHFGLTWILTRIHVPSLDVRGFCDDVHSIHFRSIVKPNKTGVISQLSANAWRDCVQLRFQLRRKFGEWGVEGILSSIGSKPPVYAESGYWMPYLLMEMSNAMELASAMA